MRVFNALPAGDSAVLMEFGREIKEGVNQEVLRLAQALQTTPPKGVRGVIPAYTTLLVEFDPLETSAQEVIDRAQALTLGSGGMPGRRFLVPTCYGGECGPDLEEVASRLGLTPDEVVRIHTSQDFLIFCLGFSPGFPLCGILPKEIEIPRRPSPRPKVPAGAVGLAGRQTGVYPAESPGGWQLIGRTPVPLFDLSRDPPVPFRPGDSLRFQPIQPAEYRRLQDLAAQGELVLREAFDGQG